MQNEDFERLSREVLEIYGAVCNRVLRYAQMVLSTDSQFQAFRHVVLDEFGEQGATKKVKRLFRLNAGNGMDRDGES